MRVRVGARVKGEGEGAEARGQRAAPGRVRRGGGRAALSSDGELRAGLSGRRPLHPTPTRRAVMSIGVRPPAKAALRGPHGRSSALEPRTAVPSGPLSPRWPALPLPLSGRCA